MEKQIAVAMGLEKADLVLKGGNVINVFTGEVEVADIAISDGMIAGVGSYSGKTEVDMQGKYLAPGFIDGHLHIESTMLSPANFAKAVLPWGTTTGICDPHEIANVCGEKGVDYMIKESETVPFDAMFMAPSCVPATPYENNGATIDADGVNRLLDKCHGVGEFMNAPGVIYCDSDVMNKLRCAKERGVVVDGHYPLAGEKELNAYIGAGISTDHECVDIKDACDKLRRGMYVLVREGSATRNLRDLFPIINSKTLRRLVFCTDDRQVHDLLTIGHINNNIKIAIEMGLSPIDAITMATLNAAECYKLYDRGALSPGRIADIVVIDDLYKFNILQVYKNGQLVAKDGKALFGASVLECVDVRNTVHCKDIKEEDFALKLTSNKVRVIGIEPHNVTTKSLVKEVSVSNGVYDFKDGLSKICVVERHKNTGNIGIGLIEGYDIKNGAIAVSVAHDSHNIIVCGDNDKDMAIAVNETKRVGGGMTAVHNGEIFDTLELPIAGLMSDRDIDYIATMTAKLNDFAYKTLNVNKEVEPFMTLSFMSLVVIPELKISDRGLFDYSSFNFVKIEV
ncbi:MAG: adenine deaminase [Clostridia bacterium]|nr:adenine deaminase [Clostridia bacterium]